MLLQSADRVAEPGDDPANWELKAGPAADPAQLADLAFAWKACRSVKSNAILLASGGASVGVGMGQVNRVDSARLAVHAGGGPGGGLGGRQRRVLPVPGRLRDPGRGRGARGGRAGRLDPRSPDRHRRQAAGVSLYFTGVRHFYH